MPASLPPTAVTPATVAGSVVVGDLGGTYPASDTFPGSDVYPGRGNELSGSAVTPASVPGTVVS